MQCVFAWKSNSEVVIDVKSTLAKSRACCWVTDFAIVGNLSIEMYPLKASMPPFQHIKISFKERPVMTLRLKFKDTAFGEVKFGRSSIGSTITSALKARLLLELEQALTYPASVTVHL